MLGWWKLLIYRQMCKKHAKIFPFTEDGNLKFRLFDTMKIHIQSSAIDNKTIVLLQLLPSFHLEFTFKYEARKWFYGDGKVENFYMLICSTTFVRFMPKGMKARGNDEKFSDGEACLKLICILKRGSRCWNKISL